MFKSLTRFLARRYQPLVCSFLALGLLFGELSVFAAPASAQLSNYWGDGRIYNYNRGVAGFTGLSGYSPYTTGSQYGYSAWSGYASRRPGTGAGTAIGLGMYGGMVGIGALAMGSQLLARRKMNQHHNNPKANQKLASKERRQSQELKIRGEMDNDYQKELAEKGMLPPTAQLPGSMAGPGPGGNFNSAPAPQSFGGPGASGMQSTPAFNPVATPPQEQLNVPVYNPAPWSPGNDSSTNPSF